jgi:hypothetical protein
MRSDGQITADTKQKSNIPNSVKFYIHFVSIILNNECILFSKKIQIVTLLKRDNKNVDIKISAHERFWNNLHQDQKIGKPNN